MLITELIERYNQKQINLIKAMNSGKLGFENYLDNVFELEIHSQDGIPYTIAYTRKGYIDIKVLMQSVLIKTNNIIQTINKEFKDSSISKYFLEDNQKYVIINIEPKDDSIEIEYYLPKIEKVIDLLQGRKTNNQVIQIINTELQEYNNKLNYIKIHRPSDKRTQIELDASIKALINLKLKLGGQK